MLVEFSVSNFRSFRDRTVLSLVAASRDKSHPRNATLVADKSGGADLRLLTTAAIYGANASGKSNLMRALRVMRHFIVNSADTKIFSMPFKLDETYKDKPSTFEMIFYIEGIRYGYGFSTTKRGIVGEWLHSYPKGRKRVLFSRSLGKRGQSKYYFGSHWKGGRKSLTKMTREDVLFLTTATKFNNKVAARVFEWFEMGLQEASWLPSETSEHAFTAELLVENPHFKEHLLKFLDASNLGVSDISVEIGKNLDRIPSALDAIEDGAEETTYRISSVHQGVDAEGQEVEVDFDFSDESDGTQKLFAMFGPVFFVLSQGCTLFVDELDARLHPLQTRNLIKLFHLIKLEKRAQLVFTTHDSSLLDQDLFRRDQIWFTEKNEEGATELYSLWDIKSLRTKENIRKGYLSGRYGAIPFLGTFAMDAVEDEIEPK